MKDNASKSGEIPLWADCHARGMTAQEAAQARGVPIQNAYNWANRNSISFDSLRKRRRQAWIDCHAAGMTAPAAARRLGLSKVAAYKWAASNGKKWPKCKPGRESGPNNGQKARKRKLRPPVKRAKLPRVAILAELTPQEAEDCELLYKLMRYSWPERLRSVKRHDLADRWVALAAQPKGGV